MSGGSRSESPLPSLPPGPLSSQQTLVQQHQTTLLHQIHISHFSCLVPSTSSAVLLGTNPLQEESCDESSPRGWQRVPTTTLQILTAALLAGLMGRAGSMQFPVIPEPAQMSPLIICCVGSLALPAPCLSLHSTGGWRGAQSHKAEPLQPPPMAGPTCPPPSARPLPVSGRIPPASCSLGILSFPKHQFHAHIPPATSLLPEDAESPGQAALLG